MATCWCGQPEEFTHSHTSLSGSGLILVGAAKECPHCECGGANIAGDHHGACRSELAVVRAESDAARKLLPCGHCEQGNVDLTNPDLNCMICDLRAELEREKADRALIQKNVSTHDEERVVHLTKERDEAYAQVAVLASTLRGFDGLKDSPETALIAAICRDAVASLPAASLALLREVEALRGMEKAADAEHHATGAYRGTVCDTCEEDWPCATRTALDAVEAGRKG